MSIFSANITPSYFHSSHVVEWRSVHGRFLDCIDPGVARVSGEGGEVFHSVAQESQLTRLRRPSSCYTQGPSQLGARGITLLRAAGGLCAAVSMCRNQGIFLGTPQKFPRPRLSYPRGDFTTFLSSLVCCDCAVSGLTRHEPQRQPDSTYLRSCFRSTGQHTMKTCYIPSPFSPLNGAPRKTLDLRNFSQDDATKY